MNNKENSTGYGSNNKHLKTTVEPKIHIPPLGFSSDDEFPIDCDVFHEFRDMVLPESKLRKNGILSSLMQLEDDITGEYLEPWLSSLTTLNGCNLNANKCMPLIVLVLLMPKVYAIDCTGS